MLPGPLLDLELAPAERGQFVETRASVVRRGAPAAGDQPALFEAIEGRVQGTLLHEDRPAGDLLDAEQHAVAVHIPQRDGLENDEVEVPREQFSRRVQGFS